MLPRNLNIIYWLNVGLVATAHLATEIVLGDEHGVVSLILSKFAAILAIVGFICWRSRRHQWQPSGLTLAIALLLMWGPMIMEPLWRTVLGVGHAFELQLLIGFRNLALLSLIYSHHERYERMAVLTSLFAILFSVSTSNDISLGWICGLYMVLGVSWLCLKYWSALRTETIVGTQRRAPWGLLTVVTVLLLGTVFTISLPRSARTRMVQGFMPSSGGTGEHDAFARSGVGDGDALVAATNQALTFAPLEEAPFIEGQEPSLYDVYQDSYGKPKPPTKHERAIGLPPKYFNHNHNRMAQAKKSSRTFTLARQPKKQSNRRTLQDTESNALLHLVGPVPAHLRHTTYDLFDGVEWYPETIRPNHRRLIELKMVGDKPWISWPERQSPVGVGKTHHALRILNVDTNRLLAPANLCGVHIDLCDRPDLFQWVQEDVLMMKRSRLPSMTVIHVVSNLIDPWEMERLDKSLGFGLEDYRILPEGPGMQSIKDLAETWTRDATTDWERVCAIRDHLQQNFVHDTDVVVPEDCENPIQWFLQDSQRGPDYLFASATVMMCRSLGISSRAVSGLYAHPEKFDFANQQTSVHPSDTHWWAEVYLGTQYWVTVESTPGYETEQPPHSLLATIGMWCWRGTAAMLTYWPVTLGCLALLALMIHRRRVLRARWLTWWWDLRFRKPRESMPELRGMLLETASIFDHKLRLARTPRPCYETISRHLRKQGASPSDAQSELADRRLLADAIDWASYSTQETFAAEPSGQQLHQLCRQLVHSTEVNPRKSDHNKYQGTGGL